MTERTPEGVPVWLARMQASVEPKDLGFAAIAALVALRVLDGVIWFSGAAAKTPWNGWGWFPEWLQKEATYAQLPPYKTFLEVIVLPNLQLFGWLQFLTESALAVMLIFGIFTRLGGWVATLWALNIAVGSYPVPGENALNLALFVLVPLVIATTAGGKALSVDEAWLRPRLERAVPPRLREYLDWVV